MNTNIITPPLWLQLSVEERLVLREKLGIPRTGGTIVNDNHVVSDGCTQEDLKTITVAKLQGLLDSTDTDFFALWTEAVMTARSLVEQKKEEEGKVMTAERLADEEKAATISASIALKQVMRLPTAAKVIVFHELEKHLFPFMEQERADVGKTKELKTKNKSNERTKETQEGSDIRSDEGAGDGSKEAEGTGKE